jgi:2-keto-myo-inositol isomerase
VTELLSRREWLTRSAALGATCMFAAETTAAEPRANPVDPFGYCLNTSTIRGQKLPITAEVEIAARAGYQGIEPWIRELEEFVKGGGSLKDLGKQIRDLGLHVPSAIGFAEWIVDDPTRRKKGLEQAKRDMELVQQIGGTRIAAPPAGATDQAHLDLLAAAERYRALCELGEKMGIAPEAEVWGFSKSLKRLGEAVLVAIESAHPAACVLPDVFHLYKGGSDVAGLRLIRGSSIGIFHMNDYPLLEREKIKDADRVYPGDGGAPLTDIFRGLRDIGYRGMLSLELFNVEIWKQDALHVAKTGLDKMRQAVRKALA